VVVALGGFGGRCQRYVLLPMAPSSSWETVQLRGLLLLLVARRHRSSMYTLTVTQRHL